MDRKLTQQEIAAAIPPGTLPPILTPEEAAGLLRTGAAGK
jgi:hypothetical protein